MLLLFQPYSKKTTELNIEYCAVEHPSKTTSPHSKARILVYLKGTELNFRIVHELS